METQILFSGPRYVGHSQPDAAVPGGDQSAGDHQHRHHWPRGPRQEHRGQGTLRRSHRQVGQFSFGYIFIHDLAPWKTFLERINMNKL